MTPAVVVAGGLLILGLLADAPGLVVIAVLTLATSWLSTLWSRHGLAGVTYERRLEHDRAVWGDEVELTVTIDNAKLLPLAWIEAEDFASRDLSVRGRRLLASSRPGLAILQNLYSLGPYEQVRRTFHVIADHRGLYRFDSVRLSVADLFGRNVARSEEPSPATFLVRPRTVPVRTQTGSVVPLGTRRARRGQIEDPSLFAGVRPFQRGDPRRRIHERASARVGRPMSKRFEPSTARQALVALDIQTHDDPIWLLAYDEALVESLAVAAASLARQLLADGAACGLAVNGWTYSLARTGFVPPGRGVDQLSRIADALGRTSSTASLPFAQLLAGLPGRVAPGTLVFAMSSREPLAIVPVVRRLRSSGFEVRHIVLGPHARAHAARGRRLGIETFPARLDPDWRTSDALTIAI